MQDIEQLPLEHWASQLKAARQAAGIEFSALAQELRLSPAQLRGLETGSLSAFHGPGYYLRAVEKCAQRLDIVLDPPVTELKLTDSQLALKRVKNTPSASQLAKKQSNVLGAHAMPSPMRRTRIGLWLGAILIVLVATGTWFSVQEGWPNGTNGTSSNSVDSAMQTPQATQATETVTANPMPIAAADHNDQAPGNELASTTTETQGGDLFGTPLATEPAEQPNEQVPSEAQTTAEKALPSTPQTTATEAPSVNPTPAPTPADVIEASFKDDCWVEIRRVDGSTEQGIYKPGQTVVVDVADIERLTFGNAAAVSATRAGQAFDIMRFTRGGNNVARIAGDALN